jgi:hypothetical protein
LSKVITFFINGSPRQWIANEDCTVTAATMASHAGEWTAVSTIPSLDVGTMIFGAVDDRLIAAVDEGASANLQLSFQLRKGQVVEAASSGRNIVCLAIDEAVE